MLSLWVQSSLSEGIGPIAIIANTRNNGNRGAKAHIMMDFSKYFIFFIFMMQI